MTPPEQGPREFTTAHTLITAAAVGVTSMSFNFWYPFLPLYLLDIGATSDANALVWVAIATSVQGVLRLASGPVWGVMSDRMGRKMMFLRALYLSSTIGGVAAFATEPWQIVVALGLAGLFSGFNPAAVAFVSVSVPDARLNRTLSTLTGAQYIGSTLGPALGAALAIILGYRGAILAGSIIPIVSGTAVLLFVPSDMARRTRAKDDKPQEEPKALAPFIFTFQFFIAVVMSFTLFAVNQLVRLATPIALVKLEGKEDVAGLAGLTFTLGGIVSVVSVLFIAPRFFKPGGFRLSMAAGCVLAAIGFVLLAISSSTASYIVGFTIIALVISSMSPATNTLIAANASRERRGTAFGVASSAQALSFMVGPAGAALFAAVSLVLGFTLLGVLLVGLAVFLFVAMREPTLVEEPPVETKIEPGL